ncbi:MAG: hypothetical protein HZC36_15620 [Armatimonadetes bacterium]|nr:hypothetical protein [Armatimonadota bacterium]
MKVRAPVKILVGFLIVVGAVYYGKDLYANISLRKEYPPIAPGTVNLLGVDTRAGYHIVVANRVAQLVMGSSGQFAAPEQREENSEDGTKKRVPIRELLGSLSGDLKALSAFVMKLNDIKEEDFSPVAVVWTMEDLERAMAGDKALQTKLETDLNVKLDGTPLSVVNPNALEAGILIDMPVEIALNEKGKAAGKKLVARLREPYQPRFTQLVHKHYEEKTQTREMVLGYYREEAQRILNGEERPEDIASSLKGRYAAGRRSGYAEAPERILNSVEVIVNDSLMGESQVTKAVNDSGKPLFNLNIDLKGDGRNRLWKYSRGKVGTQLLLVWNGVAVAAPAIEHELSGGQVTITQMEDEEIVNQVAKAIKSSSNGEGNR